MTDLSITGDLTVSEGDVVYNEYVETVTLQPDDILHIRVGIEDMGDGQPPWIPSPDDLAKVKEEWETVAPEARVIVTHFGVEATLIPTEPATIEVVDD